MPLRVDLYKRLVGFALSRFGGENASETLPHVDLRFIFAGGKDLLILSLAPFQGSSTS